MTTITASLVKELRDKTGAGMMDCKTALTETNGDIEAAIDWLRKKGLSKAAKKADRVAADGLIGVVSTGTRGAVVEVNSETDFVARNDTFQKLVQDIAQQALEADGDFAKLLAAKYPGTSNSVEDHVKEMVATIGENMSVRRAAGLSVKDGVIAEYVHGKVANGVGKIGVLVALESAGDKDALNELGRMIAMHIAAASPVALDETGISDDIIAREKAILEEKNQGKKPEVMEKIVAGGIKAFMKDNTLLQQPFVHDTGKTVAQAVKESEGKVGKPVTVAGFLRYALGEGIEKKSEDFAAEVAKAVGGSN